MIDAGAVLKLNRAAIEVGSTSLQVDRSGAACRCWALPKLNVYFTSFKDTAIRLEDQRQQPRPRPRRLGGLVVSAGQGSRPRALRMGKPGDLPRLREPRRFALRRRDHSRQRSVADHHPGPLGPRPAGGFPQSHHVRRRRRHLGRPNSFEETNFHAPPYQFVSTFTSDYDRVGPDIHRNTLVNNTTNALFLRILTPAGQQIIPLTVSGRWDDTDIVHVVAEDFRYRGRLAAPSSRTRTTRRRRSW